MGRERFVYVYWCGNGARGKVEKNPREKQRPGGYWRQWDKRTKMEGSPSKGGYLNLRDNGKGKHASFKNRSGTWGHHFSAISRVFGEIGGEVICWKWWVRGVGWGLEGNHEESASLLGKWEGVRIKTNKRTWNFQDPIKIGNGNICTGIGHCYSMNTPCNISCLDYLLKWINKNHSFLFKICPFIKNYWVSMRHVSGATTGTWAAAVKIQFAWPWCLGDTLWGGVHSQQGPEETTRGKCLVVSIKPCQLLYFSVSLSIKWKYWVKYPEPLLLSVFATQIVRHLELLNELGKRSAEWPL